MHKAEYVRQYVKCARLETRDALWDQETAVILTPGQQRRHGGGRYRLRAEDVDWQKGQQQEPHKYRGGDEQHLARGAVRSQDAPLSNAPFLAMSASAHF